MPRKIEDLSIFGEYKQPENRLTAAFLQICKMGGEGLIRQLSHLFGFELPDSEISIFSQAVRKGSVPDGFLESGFSFRMLVESKAKKNAINMTQLMAHKSELKRPTDFLVYITPDESKPGVLGDIPWASWGNVADELEQYIENPKVDNLPILEFLVGHFRTLITNMRLAGGQMDLNNDQVMVLAGSQAEDNVLNYGHYICQNRRSFRSSRYIAFFNNNRIRYVFEILESPMDDVDLTAIPELSEFLAKVEPEYDTEDRRRVFRLQLALELDPIIINDTTDKNGNPCPYTYGQPRYTTLARIKMATKTSEL